MRVLVVDDELYTREGIIDSVDWNKYGIKEVMDADDGQTALEIIEWFQPDIVISDVKMPRMDGISFAKKFVEKYPDSKIIFMSAYMEIQYYQQAIKLAAVDYVEKPLYMEEMENAIQKAIKSISLNREREKNQKENQLLSYERLVNYLVTPRKELINIHELCEKLHFPEDGFYLGLCFRDMERENDRHTVMRMIKEFFEEKKIKCIVAPFEHYQYCTIISVWNESCHNMKETCSEFICQYPSFQIGIGFFVDHLNGISESWKLARDVINMAFYEPEKTLFEIDGIQKPVQTVKSSIYSRVVDTISGEPDKLVILLDAIYEEFNEHKALKPSSIKTFANAVVSDILKAGDGTISSQDEIFWGMEPDEYIEHCDSLHEVFDFLRTLAKRLTGNGDNTTNYSPIVRTAQKYIRNHCENQNLGLLDIADACNISSGHLSSVFKKETGITTRQYIEDYRLMLAKEKLLTTNDRISDISRKCGFVQPGYFSKVFKQKMGMTPAEYRDLNGKE